MDVDNEVQRLQRLVEDPQANLSEIVRIYHSMAKDGNSALSSVLSTLNKLAVHLLSPEVISILLKHRLEAFSYILVANNLLDMDELKDDLENGNVLVTNVPASTTRRLKKELGIAPTLTPAAPAIPPATPPVASATLAPVCKLQAQKGTTISMDSGTSRADANSLPMEIKNQCVNIKIVNGMTLYKLPLRARTNLPGASSIVKRFSFGEPDRFGNKACKTILLMGATGSGKTTMINAMINYVLGVRWEDPFRFILVDEKETCQAFSQTRDVTAYDIHYRNGFRVPFSLTIVDTPGFGDTQGIDRDKEITLAVKQFFEHKDGIQELDAVGFTVQASQVRLTSSQSYIFNSVLSIFGKDIRENVRFLVTFDVGGQPPVLAAIKEANLPCLLDSNGEPCHQSFNNRTVYVSNQTGDRLSPIEWDIAMQNFQLFFAELSKMPVKSLQLTKEVLNKREILLNSVDCLEMTVQAHLMKMEELRKIEEVISRHKDDVDANRNFEFTTTVPKKRQVAVDSNLTAMNCSRCEVTCQYPYNPKSWSILTSLARLDYIGAFFEFVNTVVESMSNPSCKVCPGKCTNEDHVSDGTRWIYVQEKETRTLYDVRKKYDNALEKTLSAEELKNALQAEVEQLKFDIVKSMGDITSCSNLLKKIALRGDPLTTPEYIILMIENEEKERKSGYKKRIKSLNDILKKAQLTKDIIDGGRLANQLKTK